MPVILVFLSLSARGPLDTCFTQIWGFRWWDLRLQAWLLGKMFGALWAVSATAAEVSREKVGPCTMWGGPNDYPVQGGTVGQ